MHTMHIYIHIRILYTHIYTPIWSPSPPTNTQRQSRQSRQSSKQSKPTSKQKAISERAPEPPAQQRLCHPKPIAKENPSVTQFCSLRRTLLFRRVRRPPYHHHAATITPSRHHLHAIVFTPSPSRHHAIIFMPSRHHAIITPSVRPSRHHHSRGGHSLLPREGAWIATLFSLFSPPQEEYSSGRRRTASPNGENNPPTRLAYPRIPT
jgi:hypothetical protein